MSYEFDIYVKEVQSLVKYKEPTFNPSLIKGRNNIMGPKIIGFLIQKMKMCAEDVNNSSCKHQILIDNYWLGLFTKNDAKMHDYINSIADGVQAYIIGENSKTNKASRKLLQKNEMRKRVLEFSASKGTEGISV